MSGLNRREFLRYSASGAIAGGMLCSGLIDAQANPLGLPIGSQTYPHRAKVKEDFPALLKQFSELGIKSIELCSPFSYGEFAGLSDGRKVGKLIRDHGLTCFSGHFGMRELRQTQEKSIAWAKEVGISQMITASLGGSNPTLDIVKKAAEEYNRIAEVAAKAGIQQGLHNEGFEVSSVDGRRTYDILLELLDPKLVKFQFQMSTIRNGFDAAEYFTKYPGRFFSMHLQDWNAASQTQTSVGKGTIDWKYVFRAAKIGGVKNYFLEQSMEMTIEGIAYLKKAESLDDAPVSASS